MKRPREAPLFLAHDTYRRRRLMDAARILPVVAAVLMALPILWAPDTATERDTALNTVYLFTLWLALIAVAFVLSRALSRVMAADAPPPPVSDRPAGGVAALDSAQSETAGADAVPPANPAGGLAKHGAALPGATGPGAPRS
jgi:hypothetical protein